MNSRSLYEIVEETTKIFRKGSEIERKNSKGLEVVEIYGYPPTSESEAENLMNLEMIDMIFINVEVNKELAEKSRRELEIILDNYPQPERLRGGPSYIELAPNLGAEQETALRLMALGKVLGYWDIMSGKTLGLTDQEAKELAGQGLLMISGYKKPGVKT